MSISVNRKANGHSALTDVANELALNALQVNPEQAQRFYPEQLPAFANEPTRDRFEIRQVGLMGEGVVSLVDFEPGEIVFTATGFFSPAVTLFSLQITPELHLHDPYFYGKLLHSCDPNTYVDVATRTFWSRKPIKAGDFVTLDYAMSEDYLFRTFPCHCGAENCRGVVAGAKQLAMQPVATRKRQ